MGACKATQKPSQFRHLNIKVQEDVLKLYVDKDMNFVFRDHYLEEEEAAPADTSVLSNATIAYDDLFKNELLRKVQELELKLEKHDNSNLMERMMQKNG